MAVARPGQGKNSFKSRQELLARKNSSPGCPCPVSSRRNEQIPCHGKEKVILIPTKELLARKK